MSGKSVCPHVSFRPSRVVKAFHLFSCFLLRSNFRNMRMRTERSYRCFHQSWFTVKNMTRAYLSIVLRYSCQNTGELVHAHTHIILVLILLIMLRCKLLHNFLMASLAMPSFWTWWSSFLVCKCGLSSRLLDCFHLQCTDSGE